MALLRRPSGGQRDDYNELAALWIEGLTTSHDAACSCGGMGMPALDPKDIELDLLDYLADKYRRDNLAELLALIEHRLAPGAKSRFESWLDGLRDAALSPDARTRLLADLRAFLDSFAERARPRVGICY